MKAIFTSLLLLTLSYFCVPTTLQADSTPPFAYTWTSHKKQLFLNIDLTPTYELINKKFDSFYTSGILSASFKLKPRGLLLDDGRAVEYTHVTISTENVRDEPKVGQKNADVPTYVIYSIEWHNVFFDDDKDERENKKSLHHVRKLTTSPIDSEKPKFIYTSEDLTRFTIEYRLFAPNN